METKKDCKDSLYLYMITEQKGLQDKELTFVTATYFLPSLQRKKRKRGRTSNHSWLFSALGRLWLYCGSQGSIFWGEWLQQVPSERTKPPLALQAWRSTCSDASLPAGAPAASQLLLLGHVQVWEAQWSKATLITEIQQGELPSAFQAS